MVVIGLLFINIIGIYRQVDEMVRVYGPIKTSAEAAKTQADAAAGQLDVMKGQLNEMQAGQRPWVHLTAQNSVVIESPLHFDENGAHLAVRFNTRNSGHSPARFVLVEGAMFVSDGSVEKFNESWKKCNDVKSQEVTFMRAGKTVFPEQEYQQGHRFDVPVNDLKLLESLIDNKMPKAILITGCIDYSFEAKQSEHHQTRFIFEIDKRGPNETFAFIDPRNGDLAAQQVAVEINPLIGDDAD
jgi:hypothetical protein